MSNYNVAFLCCAGIGSVLVQLGVFFFPDNWWNGSDSSNWVILVCLVLGGISVLIGTVLYAIGKGYRWWLGLLGLVTPVGIVILAALPERNSGAR